MKQYIIMNKDENRLQVENEFGLFTLSGQLGNKYVKCFKPVIYKSKWLAKWKAWQYDCVVVEVGTSDINIEAVGKCYVWLQHKLLGTVHKYDKEDINSIVLELYTEFKF